MKGGKRALVIVGGIGIVLGALLTLFTINLAGNTLVPAGLISPHYRGTAPEEMTNEMMERLSAELRNEQRPLMVKYVVKGMDTNDVPGILEEMMEALEFPETFRTWSAMDRRMETAIREMEGETQGARGQIDALHAQMDREFADAEKTMECSVKTFDQNKGMVKVCVPKK